MNKKLSKSSDPYFFYLKSPKEFNTMDDGDFQTFMDTKFPDALEINEDIVNAWTSYLSKFKKSMVTTNPSIINFLDDDFAKDQVIVPTRYGFSQFGKVPELVGKLNALGPGEAILDAELNSITPLPSNLLKYNAPWTRLNDIEL